MAVVNATTLENGRLSGAVEERLLRLRQLLQMVHDAVGEGNTPAWLFTVDDYVVAIDDAFRAYHGSVWEKLLPLARDVESASARLGMKPVTRA